MRNTILVSLFLLTFIVTGIAQNSKANDKATKYVEKFNTAIVSVDNNLALSDKQVEKMKIIQLERIQELAKIKEEQPDKTERKKISKPINKKYMQRINKEVLSKKQLDAYKIGKKNTRTNKKK